MSLTRRITCLLLAAVFALAGCGAGGSSDSFGAKADREALSKVTWADSGADAAPVLTFETPFTVAGSAVRVIDRGDGAELTEGTVMWLGWALYSGTTGEQLATNYEDRSAALMTIAKGATDPELYQALKGLKRGAKLVQARPGNPEALDPAEVEPKLMAIVVEAVGPGYAAGTPVDPVAGMPTVKFNRDGMPLITIPKEDPPAEFTSELLVSGDGPVVDMTDSIMLQVAGWLWDGEARFQSTWHDGSPMLAELVPSGLGGALTDGLVEGLLEQKVGSRILMVVPPAQGYGEAGTSYVPGGATLVYVVDLLAKTS